MRGKKNTTPATEGTKAQTQSQPATNPAEERKEVKPMKEEKKNTKNTTPATSTPAEKKESKRTPPANKDTKSKTPAEKKSKKKASKPAEPMARIEDNNIIVKVVKQTVTTTNTTTELVEKKIPFPANAKAEEISNLANLIQCKVLVQLKEKFASELAKIKPAKDQPLTEEQKEKKKLVNAKIKLVNSQLEKYEYNADKIAILINEPMAEMLACWVTGEKLSLELNNFKTCLRANYQTLGNMLDRLLKGETVTKTEEEEKIFTTFRQSLKKDLESYTKASHYFNQFKLSISLTDIRKWYEVSRLDIANDTFIFDDKKDTTLSKAIVKWFLTKLKVEPKEEPASK